MRALLDVTILLALLDQTHQSHLVARAWLDADIEHGWASCAITENDFIRIISQPSYPNQQGAARATDRLAQATRSHHEFWPCDISILDSSKVDRRRLHGSRQITDAYLLALAVAQGGRLVTFDRAIPLSSVLGARPEHLVVL